MDIKPVFISLITIIAVFGTSAQSLKLDSLKLAYKSQKNDSVRVHILLNISRASGLTGEVGNLYCKKALKLAKEINYNKGVAMAYDQMGVFERNRSSYSSSLTNHNLALRYISSYGNCREKAIILNNIGVVYRRLDELYKATDYHLKALVIAEELHDGKTVCVSNNSLGNIFFSQGNYEEALKYFSKALELEKKMDNLLGEAINLNNIGAVYAEQKNFSKAIDFLNQSLKLNQKLSNEQGIAICYNGLGEVFYKSNNYKRAIEMYKKALEINQRMSDRIYTSVSYTNIGEILTSSGDLNNAEPNIRKGLEIALDIGSKDLIERGYSKLSELYIKKGLYKLALEAYQKSIAYKDSVINEKSNNTIARLKTIYETEQKEKEIKSQKHEIKVNKKELLRERALKLLFISCFAAMVLVSVLLFRNYRLKKKANAVLLSYNQNMDDKNRILMMQKEEILTQRDQIEEKNNVVNKAYDLIKDKNKSIIENIRYALQIQNAMLPSINKIREYLPKSFILYKPRDIVSGDFYWVFKKDDKLIVAVADCTGHGVSGAFMSILGISALNEIVNERGITQPNLILDSLRERIIWSLQQEEKFWEAKDGIDMSIVAFDFKSSKVSFSGANSSFILIRNDELTQIRGDRMPVSIFPTIIPFSSTEVNIYPNDSIYIYTDGYYHQFGGLYGKKFGTRQFRSVLLDIHKLDVKEQQENLDQLFDNWRGSNEQVDDILLVGISVTPELFTT